MYGRWLAVALLPILLVLVVIALIAAWGLPLIAVLIAAVFATLAVMRFAVSPSSDEQPSRRPPRPSMPPQGGGTAAADEMGSQAAESRGAPVSGEGAR
jgi:hypothetical protein